MFDRYEFNTTGLTGVQQESRAELQKCIEIWETVHGQVMGLATEGVDDGLREVLEERDRMFRSHMQQFEEQVMKNDTAVGGVVQAAENGRVQMRNAAYGGR